MVINEERRIVAAKLRKIKQFEDDEDYEDEGISWCDVDEVRETLGIYYDYDPCICEAEKVKRLADLIDRPTTKREGGCGAYWRCTRCGAFNRKDAVTDCCGVIPSRYCAYCSAEVIE